MNTNKLKAYAPKARLAFMDAVKKRAAVLGIYENKISEATTQGTDTLIEGRIFTRKQGQQRQQLVKRIEALGGGKDGYNQFINEMAFTWFNRFTAIRFMEVNGYLDHGFRMLSKEVDAEFGQGFEILAHAADVAEDLDLNKADIVEMLLAGDKEEELYRELLLAQCHQLSNIMPFMFEKLDDATELLLPDNLTKTDSILKDLVNDVPEDNWHEIEVIGWLYQFYISEHKDAVIGKVVKKEDIPAATQLFTPNWIVKYLVQNSLGRQWLATYPDSELRDKMEYYITPAEQNDEVIEQLKAITPTSIDPEQIKVLDPACGSGHILVEVYEVLRDIYLERGYRLREIPELILTKNIFGLDIDDRAAQMAAFAVLMKAREDDKRIFTRDIKLNIYSIQSTENLNINQLWSDLDLDGSKQTGSMGDLFSQPQLAESSAKNKVYLDLLLNLKEMFIDAKNLGSLIKVDSQLLEHLIKLQDKLADKDQGSKQAASVLLPIVKQAILLATKYDVSVTNPPYLSSKGMNTALKTYARMQYPNSKSDTFAMFIDAGFRLTKPTGFNSLVTMQSWMFLNSFEELRHQILNNTNLHSMIHVGYNSFPSLNSKIALAAAFVCQNAKSNSFVAKFIDLNSMPQSADKKECFLNIKAHDIYEVKQKDLLSIPGYPFAYAAKPNLVKVFKDHENEKPSEFRIGMATGKNDDYVRLWHEISVSKMCATATSRKEAKASSAKWFPYAKGGEYRKWYGNFDSVVDWSYDGHRIQTRMHPSGSRLWGHNFNLENIFKPTICWTVVTTSKPSFRFHPVGFLFDAAAGLCQVKSDSDVSIFNILGVLNSNYSEEALNLINPTLNLHPGYLSKLPLLDCNNAELVKKIVDYYKEDWNRFETSLDFKFHSMVKYQNISKLKEICSASFEADSQQILDVMNLERHNNELVIEKYALHDISTGEFSKEDVTLTINKIIHGGKNSPFSNYSSRIVGDLISYSLGCMMGRYSLDREGLVYAHSGNNGFKGLVAEGAYKTFPADDDGIIPLAAEEWLFDDDATSRFRDFVKTVWGEEHLQENLDFVAESLCLDAIKPKKNESSMETIRRYFSTQFYKDHLKTYKKRPIYWLFSSGKEKAFECLVYLHRYNESTLARMRTEYVTPLMGKLETQHSVLMESRTNASSTEQRRIDKELKSIEKKQSELRAFDEELKHLAEMKISIDLDDGVKVNYGKFGNLLADVKAIHGKNPEEIK
ncbi:TPA: BREX-1 system adenine-specific DNA-methyltransferase PglX [Vibrio cholerae]|nr:BREX-1 system adenine-specific DNA-methyltransferase PglX [Vibrio cholerae]